MTFQSLIRSFVFRLESTIIVTFGSTEVPDWLNPYAVIKALARRVTMTRGWRNVAE